MKLTMDRAAWRRLLACLLGGCVLALMYGNQEGTQTDFGIAFRHATSAGRLLLFLAIGLAVFLMMTFWPLLAPYVRRPGASGIAAGFVLVLAALVTMNWYDPVGKFGALSDQVAKTSGLDLVPSAYFGWLAWTLWLGCLVVGLVAVATRIPAIGYALTALGVVAAVLTVLAHSQLLDFVSSQQQQIDHSLGADVAAVGFLVSAAAGLVIARSRAETADRAAFFEAVMSWRRGLPVAVVGAVFALIAFVTATWFAPLTKDWAFGDLHPNFDGTGVSGLALAYVGWLGLVLVIVTALAALAATWLRLRVLALAAMALSLVGIVLTLISMYDLSHTAARVAPALGKLWQNLGSGGWVACIAYGLLGTAGLLAAQSSARADGVDVVDPSDTLPFHQARTIGTRSSLGKLVLPVVLILAVFYPPTLTQDWQNTLVTQIGPYLLLAVGLNVVVGWAGLLDLGYIAFYAIGSYTTAYITGSLPVKPPSWLHFTPLLAIPFAILACLIAGVLLGAPTLRLRGDYLAIVTLGFGEIITVVAVNNPFNITGGPRGPNVPNPVLKVGPVHVTWGLDNLPYWYLLLVILIIVIVLLYRLEGSRLGRTWAAIREDEIAAQATGINTTRVKLLAFSIGASTSGLAGVFFATQVGYFDPSLFTLQNSILIVAYVVFGGMGSLFGALAGAAVLTWLPQFLKAQVPLEDRQMWIGAILLGMMIFRPAGLIPARRRAAELHGLDAPDSAEVRAVPVSEGL